MEDNKGFINRYLLETQELTKNVDQEQISLFIDILFDAWKNGKKVITLGNGGSASTANHFAGDLLKTVVNDSSQKEVQSSKGFKAMCLSDNIAAYTAWINDSGWENVYVGLLNTLMEEGDVVLLISVHGGSGWSGNLVRAMEFAKSKGGKLLGLAGFDGGKMKEMCDACVIVPADSTPHTEGFHGVIQHLVVFRLKELIEEELNVRAKSVEVLGSNSKEKII